VKAVLGLEATGKLLLALDFSDQTTFALEMTSQQGKGRDSLYATHATVNKGLEEILAGFMRKPHLRHKRASPSSLYPHLGHFSDSISVTSAFAALLIYILTSISIKSSQFPEMSDYPLKYAYLPSFPNIIGPASHKRFTTNRLNHILYCADT